MMLRKRFASLLALLVAAMTASAADWFTTTIAATPTATGGSWTLPTGGGWVFDTSYGTLNNPTSELVFAASEAKTLPGNVATISTTVKFTAFDASDAPTNEVPSGAKGGLTIVENLDVNPPTTNFFGIVGNAWVQLVPDSGDTTAALSGQVPVVVTVSKNGDTNYIEYTVDNVALKYGGVSKIPTKNNSLASDPDIQSVSYKGVCELAALSGTASASVFELTVPTIANATVEVTAGDAVILPTSQGKYDITSGSGNVEITYAPVNGYMLNGAGTMQLSGLTGDTDVTAAFAGLKSNLIVAQIGETTYTNLQAAISAATAGQTVTLMVNDIEDVSTANANAFTLDLNAKTLTGNVTIASGAGLVTIQNGTIAGNLAADNVAGVAIEGENAVYVSGTFTGTATIAAPGGYNAAVADIQAICSVGYFAKEDGGTYMCLVEKGVAVTPTGTSVEMQVDPAAIPVGVNAADYLAANGQNGKPRWVNYAVGLEPDSAATIGVAEVSSTENTVTIGTGTTVNDASGVKVVVKSGDTVLENGALPLAAGTYNITIEVGGVQVASKEVGVAEAAAATAAEKADVKIVKVPYSTQINGQPMTIDALLNKANLAVGDKVWAYDTIAHNYVGWTQTVDRAWSPSSASTPPANTYQVVAGQGLWLQTTAETGFFQCGEVEAGQQTITLKANDWNLLALNGDLDTSDITGANEGDKIRVESSTSMVPTEYEYTSGGWTKKTITERTTAKGRKIQTVTWEPTSTITNGDSGVWYITVAGSTPTITL